MANTGFQGIDVRQTSSRLLFDALLQDSAGAIVTSGTTSLYLYELQSDGTLKSYDWNDNTFKTGTLTTETASMTHQQGNNNSTNTGLWTYALATLTGFTRGAIYYARAKNSGASPTDQVRKFQFGSAEGDLTVSTLGSLLVKLADGEAHGGTPGSSTATIAAKRLSLRQPAGGFALDVSNNGGGAAATIYSDGTGEGLTVYGGTNASAVLLSGNNRWGLVVENADAGGDFGAALIDASSSAAGNGLEVLAGAAGHDVYLGGSGTIRDGAHSRNVSVELSPTGMDQLPVADPGAPASMTSIPKMIVALWRWFYKKTDLSLTTLKVYADDGTTVNGSCGVTDTGSLQTKDALS